MMHRSKDFLSIAQNAGVKFIVHLRACGDNDTRFAHFAWHPFSHTTVAIHPVTPIASIQKMKRLPNQSSIWPRPNTAVLMLLQTKRSQKSPESTWSKYAT
jgi:hypothetical protein